MNGLLRIRQRYRGLAQSDKKLADYLLLQPDTARHLSSQQLANEAGVSQSSVVKFAQKLGYKGFPALKLALSEALASQPESPSVPIHNQIRGDDPLRLVGEKLIKENTAAMYATLNVNSEEKLHECVTMLRSARRIILTGIGASGLVAQNFARKLMKIGFNAAAVRDMHALLATVQASSPDDLLLAISYTGVRRELNRRQMRCCEWAEKCWRLPALLRMPCNSVLLIACIPLPKNKRQTVLQSLLVTLREC